MVQMSYKSKEQNFIPYKQEGKIWKGSKCQLLGTEIARHGAGDMA